MLATIATILGALAPILSVVVAWWKASSADRQQQIGGELEAAKVDQASLAAETAIATAEAQSPATPDEVAAAWQEDKA
jgi:hypothetical protein